MKKHSIEEVYVVGIALDFCVKYTSIDASELGYKTFLVKDAAKSTNIKNDNEILKSLEVFIIEFISLTKSNSTV